MEIHQRTTVRMSEGEGKFIPHEELIKKIILIT